MQIPSCSICVSVDMQGVYPRQGCSLLANIQTFAQSPCLYASVLKYLLHMHLFPTRALSKHSHNIRACMSAVHPC